MELVAYFEQFLKDEVNLNQNRIDKLDQKLFTSELRQNIFKLMKEERRNKRVLVLENIDVDLQQEIMRMINYHHTINFESYIVILIEEGYLNDFYELGTSLQDKVMSDYPSIESILDSIEAITSVSFGYLL